LNLINPMMRLDASYDYINLTDSLPNSNQKIGER